MSLEEEAGTSSSGKLGAEMQSKNRHDSGGQQVQLQKDVGKVDVGQQGRKRRCGQTRGR